MAATRWSRRPPVWRGRRSARGVGKLLGAMGPRTASDGPGRWTSSHPAGATRIQAALEAPGRSAHARRPDLAAALDVQESREAGGGADRAGVAGEFDHGGPAAAPAGGTGCNRRANGRKAPRIRTSNAQFEHINRTADEHLSAGQPVLSVDTKKKELVGNFKNGGREWQPKGTPPAVLVHDFPTDRRGQGDSVRRLRHGAQRSLCERGMGPRHPGVRGGVDSALVAADGLRRLPRGHDPASSRPMRREQRVTGLAPGSTSFNSWPTRPD